MVETGPNNCFRCGADTSPDEKYGEFHSAIITLENADSSFSGTFKLPLCYGCSMIPHNADYERV